MPAGSWNDPMTISGILEDPQQLNQLYANPLFNMGLGLLSSGYDSSINPYAAMLGGMAASRRAEYEDEAVTRDRAERDAELERQRRMRETVGQFIGKTSAPGHPGLEDGPGANFTPLQREMAGAYESAAQYGDPMQALTGYSNFLDDASLGGPGSDDPANIREWNIYSQWPAKKQKAYLEMKRGQQLETLAGEVYRMFGDLDPSDQLTKLDEEADAATTMSAAETLGKNMAAQYDVLKSASGERRENYTSALDLLGKVKAKDLPTGLYTGLVYKVIPTADQEKLDALAEFAARARLKASGEIRPTDADVEGMKRALFGSSRTEDFTRESLERLVREIESQEHEMGVLERRMNLTSTPPPAQQLPTPGTVARPPGILEPSANQFSGASDRELDALSDVPLEELIKRAKIYEGGN